MSRNSIAAVLIVLSVLIVLNTSTLSLLRADSGANLPADSGANPQPPAPLAPIPPAPAEIAPLAPIPPAPSAQQSTVTTPAAASASSAVAPALPALQAATIPTTLPAKSAPQLTAGVSRASALPAPPATTPPATSPVKTAVAATATASTPAVAASSTPNQAMAEMARAAIIKSLPPEYEKQDNWGHQEEIVDGYHWQQGPDGWHLEKQTKKVNSGQWRMYRVRLNDPDHNLQLQFTPPQPAPSGGTMFSAYLNARFWAEAIQEQWLRGVKGLNFHVEGNVTIQARLDIVITVQPAAGASFGTMEVLPQVTGVELKLMDLTLTKVDMLHGDAAKELGHAFKNIVADEMRKQEPKIAQKINAEIQKHRDKLQFSPSQIAQIGWGKIQTLLGGFGSSSTTTPSKTGAPKQ